MAYNYSFSKIKSISSKILEDRNTNQQTPSEKITLEDVGSDTSNREEMLVNHKYLESYTNEYKYLKGLQKPNYTRSTSNYYGSLDGFTLEDLNEVVAAGYMRENPFFYGEDWADPDAENYKADTDPKKHTDYISWQDDDETYQYFKNNETDIINATDFLIDHCDIKEVFTLSINQLGIKEVLSLTIDEPCSSAGTVSVSIDGESSGAISLSELTETTSTKVAHEIDDNCSFTNWVVSRSGNTLFFTATTVGPKSGSRTYSAGATGATSLSGIEVVTEGLAYASGNIEISLRGGSIVTTAIVYTVQTTPTLVATEIASKTYTGWVATSSTNTVIFTATDGGARIGDNTLDFNATGIVSTLGIVISPNGLMDDITDDFIGTIASYTPIKAQTKFVARPPSIPSWLPAKLRASFLEGLETEEPNLVSYAMSCAGVSALDHDDYAMLYNSSGTRILTKVESASGSSVSLKEIVKNPSTASVSGSFSITKNFSQGLAEVIKTTITNRCEIKEVLNTVITHPCTRREIVEATITHGCKITEVLSLDINEPCGKPEVFQLEITEPCGIKEVLSLDVTDPCGIEEILHLDINELGTAEVLSLTINNACTQNGNIGIILRGASNVDIAVTTADNTTALVAEAIKNGTYSGWGTSRTGSTIFFVSTTVGVKTGANTFTPNLTGVASTDGIEQDTAGVDYASGNVSVTLRSASPVVTSINAAVKTTPTLVAEEIAKGTYTGWVATSSTNTVIFTAVDVGVKTGANSFSAGITGIISTAGITVHQNSNISGNVEISLRDGNTVITALDAINHNTTEKVATAIRAKNYSGWTTGGTGSEVTFTAYEVGHRIGNNTFAANATGVTIDTGNIKVDVDGDVSGNLDITLRGDLVTIPVSSTDHYTIKKVADEIRNAIFTGWTTSGNEGTIIFTADDIGVRTGTNEFDPNLTYVTSTGFVQTQFANVSGLLNVTLRSGTTIQVPVNYLDHNTTDDVAAEIRSFSSDFLALGWVVSGTNSNITFTATAEEYRPGTNTFAVESTGVIGIITVVQDGYITGNVGMVLRSGTTVNTVVNSKDHYTENLVAAKIRSTYHSGWITSGTGAQIIFTAENEDLMTGTESIVPNSTQVTGTTSELQDSHFSSTVDIVLRGATPVSINVNSTSHRSTASVAAAIQAGTYPYWVPTLSGSTVTFTGDAAGTENRHGVNSITLNSSEVKTAEGIKIVQDAHITGKVDITLCGGTTISTTVTAEDHNTTQLVAAEIRNNSLFALPANGGWIVSGTGSEIIFTSIIVEEKDGSGSNTFTPNATGVTGTIEVEVVGEDSDINILLGQCAASLKAVSLLEKTSINLNEFKGAQETVALTKISELGTAIDSFLDEYDRYKTDNAQFISFKDEIDERLTYIPTRTSQINATMASATTYYQDRATLINLRIRKKAGTLIDIYRSYKGKRAMGERNTATKETKIYWDSKMIVKRVIKDGTGDRCILTEITDNESSYKFSVGDTVILVDDNITSTLSFTVTGIEEIFIDNGLDENGKIIKLKVKKIEINKKMPADITLDNSPRLVKILG